MSTPFLPSRLPLLPLLPPQVLYPYLTVSIPLPSADLALVLNSIAENAKDQRVDEGGVTSGSEEGAGRAGAGRMVAVVPVVEHERRIGRWACAGTVKRVEKSDKDDIYLLVVEGLARIRLPRSLPPVLSILPPIPLHTSTFSLPLPLLQTPSSVDLLPLASRLLPKELHERLGIIPPTLLADLLVTVLKVEWEQRVELLGTPDVEERCYKVREILAAMLGPRNSLPPAPTDRQAVILKSRKVNQPPSLAPPPQSAPRESQIPGDLQPLQSLFERRHSELSPAAAQAVHRELTRLVKIPAQSAEYGVSKTYIEWILALPWRKVSVTSKELDLDEAKRRLEEGHEGLEAVKRRVVEYLAVYRLKKQLFDELAASQRKLRDDQVTPTANGTMDAGTVDDLLELVPADTRKAIEAPPAIEKDDGPPNDVYRDKGPILLLVGPPGVGKTSIARSLADSLGRKFHRISLGGVRDEAEIRGHRRTYVGALPGALVQGLRKVGVSNPLILLDELDKGKWKLGTSNFHGDPSAALLETLDPAQNWAFHDHYLGDVPINLSQCMFVATANTVDTISPPLLDRCEVIECSGYVTDEKLAIARRFLLKKQVEENGLGQGMVELSDETLLRVILDYTREAGVRSLEREIGKICRTKAVEYSRSREQGSKADYVSVVSPVDVEKILGVAKYEQEVREEFHRPGVVTGLAYQGSGTGGILLLETSLIPGGKGRLVMTGSLGEVISESAELGLSWVKSRAVQLGITSQANEDPLKDVDLHLHLPAGAVKKDGPSAGVAMVLAFVSLLTNRSLPSTVAVTGEITLRGAITAVGGIKEKLLGASRAGITKVILPRRNRKDVQADLPESLRKTVEVVYVDRIEEVLQEVWGKGVWVSGSTGRDGVRVEARL